MLPAVDREPWESRQGWKITDLVELLSRLDHAPTRAACTAERAMLRSLGGGCQLPIAGHATVESTNLRLTGLVASVTVPQLFAMKSQGPVESAAELGEKLGLSLLEHGALPILNAN